MQSDVTDYTGLPLPVVVKKTILVEPINLDLPSFTRKDCVFDSESICACGHFWVDHDISDLDDNGVIICNLCSVLCVAYGVDQSRLSVNGGVDNWRKLPK